MRLCLDTIQEALRDLAQEKGLYVALECVTEALGPMLEANETTGALTKVPGGFKRLLGAKTGVVVAPGEEHSQLFVKDQKPYALVTHPYSVSLAELEELIGFCHEHDLTVSITGRSSHYVGRCVRVEYRKAGDK
jgi:hypothetical protein